MDRNELYEHYGVEDEYLERKDPNWIPTGEEMNVILAFHESSKELIAQLEADWQAFKQKRGW